MFKIVRPKRTDYFDNIVTPSAYIVTEIVCFFALKSLQLIIFNYEKDLQFAEAEADAAIKVDTMHFSSELLFSSLLYKVLVYCLRRC